MKKIKNILLLGILVLAFSSCKKCKECSGPYPWQDDGVQEPMLEVCSDDFESKKDFNNYIDALETEGDYECKSDFWN